MQFCRVERDHHLLVVTLDRPDVRNALHRAASDELDQIWTMFESDPELRVAILTGAGGTSFSAGYDMKEPGTPAKGSDFLAHRHPRGLGALTLRYDMSKPLIAAVNGFALGGGLELALACDIIIADKMARFAFPELRLGLIPGFGGIPRLKRDLGNAFVRDLLFTGRTVNAARAQAVGLVAQLAGEGEALRIARSTAAQITKFDSVTRTAAKKFIKPVPHDELRREIDLFCELFARPAVMAALKKFVEDSGPMPYLP